jgi:hypothetical protein
MNVVAHNDISAERITAFNSNFAVANESRMNTLIRKEILSHYCAQRYEVNWWLVFLKDPFQSPRFPETHSWL